MKINFNKIRAKHYKCACSCCKDKEKAKEMLDLAVAKAKNACPLREVQDKLQLLFSVTIDWIKGNYEKLPLGSMIAIFIAIIYFVSPIDIIPDFLPAGLIDDAFIISLVTKQIASDLERYKTWKNSVSNV
ncbi:MAG: YkvA family protein [Solirubrobacterales bacterium]